MVRNRCTHADSKIKIHEENNQKAQGNNKRQQKNTNLEKIFGMQTRKENTRSANCVKLCKEVDRVKQGCKTSLDCFVNVKEGIDFRL